MGHVTRTSSGTSANFTSEGSGYVSSDLRSGFTNSDHRSECTNSDYRSECISSDQTSGPSSVDYHSEYGGHARSKYNSNSEGSTAGSSQGSRFISEPSSLNSTSRSKDNYGGLNILTFSYDELSEATGGFTRGLIGIGSFGTVFKAEVRSNGPYAVKKLHSVSPSRQGG